MLNGKNGQKIPYVLIDLNTQRDFFEPSGARPVLNTIGLYASLRRVIAWGKRNEVPFVSTMDSHRRTESSTPVGNGYCVEGSAGHHKLSFTLFENRVFVAGDNTLSVSTELFQRHQQVIFPQRTTDLFANPKADRFITELPVEEFIIFGAVAEHEVKAVALGLLARHKRVTVVADACGCWNPCAADLAFRQMAAKGASLITIDELAQRHVPRRCRIKYFYRFEPGLLPAIDERRRRNGHRAADHKHADSARRLPEN